MPAKPAQAPALLPPPGARPSRKRQPPPLVALSAAALKRELDQDDAEDLDSYLATVGQLRLAEGGEPIPNDARHRRVAQRYKRQLIGDALLDRVAEGEFITQILREPAMPNWRVVQEWREQNYYNFGTRYERAYQWHLEARAEGMIPNIAENDKLDSRDKRIRFDMEKWHLAKGNPDKYSERVTLAGDKNNPLLNLNLSLELAALTDAQLEALEKFTEASAQAKNAPVTLDVPFEEISEDEDPASGQ